MRRPQPVSLLGTLLLNVAFPGAGQLPLGQRQKGRRMLVLFLVLAIPGAVVWLSTQSLLAVAALLPASVVSMWSQIDIRRTLDVPWWRLGASPSRTLDAIRGRDTFRPNDPVQSAPEKTTE
jgi:hypothetical protein